MDILVLCAFMVVLAICVAGASFLSLRYGERAKLIRGLKEFVEKRSGERE